MTPGGASLIYIRSRGFVAGPLRSVGGLLHVRMSLCSHFVVGPSASFVEMDRGRRGRLDAERRVRSVFPPVHRWRSRTYSLCTLAQSWTWIGFIHGLDWVEILEKNDGFDCIGSKLKSHMYQNFYSHFCSPNHLPVFHIVLRWGIRAGLVVEQE